MTEELDDEKRTWFLKGYAQAEADQEVLIKKLVKDISDLSEARNALLDDIQLTYNAQPELIKALQERDTLIDLVKSGYIERATEYIEQLENK